MKKTNLVWRLPSKLTLSDIEKMIELKIVSPEEAKELTFNTADDNEKIKALEEQVKFLKELVDKLSTQPPTVVWRYVNTYTPSFGWNVVNTVGSATMSSLGSGVGKFTTTASNNLKLSGTSVTQ